MLFIGDIHGKPHCPLSRLCDYNEDLFKKLEWIRDYCNDNHVQTIVHLGDIYDKPEASDEWKNKFIRIWKEYNGNFYSIIGKSHDLFYNTEQSFSKTCLYNLELSGVLKVLREPIDFGDAILYPLSMHIDKAKEELKHLNTLEMLHNVSKNVILLAHQFYDWSLDKRAGFTKEELQQLDFKCSLILGHDHRQHEDVNINNVIVRRPGSLMRTELSETTISQKPRVLLYDNGLWNYIEVPHKNINEIYDVNEYRLNKTNTKVFRAIENSLTNISKYIHNDNDTIVSCSKALKDLGCPPEEFEYLKTVFQDCSQPF